MTTNLLTRMSPKSPVGADGSRNLTRPLIYLGVFVVVAAFAPYVLPESVRRSPSTC